MGAWDNLSIREKADMMRAAIRNGITTLPEIKQAYNEFAEGGYLDWKEKASKYKHLDIDNDRTYDYEGWYNENPQRAWDFLNDSPDAHFDDKYKTVYHPTFSTQSKYSNQKDAIRNPQGLMGGTWNKQGTVFTMSPDGYRGPVSMDERKWYLENAEDNGVQLRETDGSLPIYDGIPWGGVLPNITVVGNRFAEGGNIYGNGGSKKSGGSFYQTHKARWNNYLLRHGVPAEQAARLSGFFSAQDALESGHGTSSAARQKNNFGGMQRLDKKTNKMVNISYPSVDAYMDAKWKMMRSRFGRALNAKTAQEYSDSLNNPKYHGKGYMYALYEGYRDGQPLDVARQTRHMNNYTKALMSIAGEKGFKASPVPAGSQSSEVEAPASIARPENPYIQFVPFTPFNPQAFGAPQAFVTPTREQFEVEQPIVEAAKDYAYSPEQLEKEERRQGLNNLSFILGMMNGGNGNSFADTIGMLTGNIAAEGGKIHIKPENRGKFTALKKRTGHSATWFKEHGTPAQKKMATFALNARHWKHGYGGHIYDGTSEDTQQMDIPYAGELPDVTVIPRRIANKAWDKVQERWVGDMPTYYAVNPETGKEEMLREIGNGKYSTYDDKHVFDVLGAEAAKKEREQWVRNGGNAGDFDKVMLGTLGLGLAPVALPETAAGVSTALANPYVDAGLTSYFGAHGLNHAINEGIDGWGDAAMTTMELMPLGRLVKPVYEGVVQPGVRLFNSPLTGNWTKIGNREYRLSPNSLGANGSSIEQRIPQITAENESVQNESIKDMFRRILSGNSDGIKTTEEMAEKGRKDLLDEISSPWYKERWKKATNGNDEQIDDLLSRMRVRITDVPMDYSKTTEQLSGKPGFATYGATVPREPYKFKLSDGTPVTDYNTGLDVQIASDRGVEARNTAYHELQHYLTNKATGTTSYPSLKFIANGPYEPLITPTSDGELLIGRGDAWQHFIMDQNEALLPERSFVYEEAMHSPQKLKKRLVEIGRTPKEADNLILKLKDEAQDMMDIQEERAHLKTWFTKDILPFLKNPNDASEIERVLAEHPDIMKNRPEKIKTLMESLRPGSIKDYAKYLAESLGIVPFIVNTNSKEK